MYVIWEYTQSMYPICSLLIFWFIFDLLIKFYAQYDIMWSPLVILLCTTAFKLKILRSLRIQRVANVSYTSGATFIAVLFKVASVNVCTRFDLIACSNPLEYIGHNEISGCLEKASKIRYEKSCFLISTISNVKFKISSFSFPSFAKYTYIWKSEVSFFDICFFGLLCSTQSVHFLLTKSPWLTTPTGRARPPSLGPP